MSCTTLLSAVGAATDCDPQAVAEWGADDVRRHAEALLRLLRAHGGDLLVAPSEAASPEEAIPVAKLEEMVAERLAERERDDQAQRATLTRQLRDAEAQLARKNGELARKNGELAEAARAADTAIPAAKLEETVAARLAERERDDRAYRERMTSENRALSLRVSEMQTQLEQKSNELAGIVRNAETAVPIKKGNAFEKEFEGFLREHIFDVNPLFKGYSLKRTGGGREKHKADHLFERLGTRVLFEEKSNDTDVPSDQVTKFRSDLCNQKISSGVMVSKRSRISTGSGRPIDGIVVDGNILFVANMEKQSPEVVAQIIAWWTLVNQSSEDASGPKEAMTKIVMQYDVLRKCNRQALRANLEIEKILLDNMAVEIQRIADYTGQSTRPVRAPTAEIRERMNALPDPTQLQKRRRTDAAPTPRSARYVQAVIETMPEGASAAAGP